MPMSPEAKEAAQKIFQGETDGRSACIHCAGLHDTLAGRTADQQPCPRVSRVEYHANGTLAAVSYWPPESGWDRHVVFPRMVYDD